VSVRAVVVAHRESLAAEGIAAALARYPGLAPVGVATTAAEAERCAERADAVAIDARIPGAESAVGRLRKRGLRVVVIGEAFHDDDDEDGGVVVALAAPVDQLASALAPGVRRGRAGGAPLSAREDQVLRLAAKGLAGKQIARVLGISPKTVEQHKTRAFKRLGVPNQAAAVAIMTQGGGLSWNPSAI
jgi:DNA-binding NarL/FixJ family response regulator